MLKRVAQFDPDNAAPGLRSGPRVFAKHARAQNLAHGGRFGVREACGLQASHAGGDPGKQQRRACVNARKEQRFGARLQSDQFAAAFREQRAQIAHRGGIAFRHKNLLARIGDRIERGYAGAGGI